jgi:hypothetical protein
LIEREEAGEEREEGEKRSDERWGGGRLDSMMYH